MNDDALRQPLWQTLNTGSLVITAHCLYFSTLLVCMVQVEGSASAACMDNGRPVKRAKHAHAVDFAKHFSEEGRLRQYPSLRKIICQFSSSDDAVPMHGGLPPSDSFPLSSMLLRLKNGQAVDMVDEQKVSVVYRFARLGYISTGECGPQIASAQQYCTTVQGYPALHSWCETHMKTMHNPPGRQEVLITNGSNHALEVRLGSATVPLISSIVVCHQT